MWAHSLQLVFFDYFSKGVGSGGGGGIRGNAIASGT